MQEEWEELQTAAEAILQEQLSEQEVLAHRELEQGMQQCRQNVTALESAVQLPLQERVAGVLSQYVAQSKRAMLEDVAAAEAEGRARASAVKAEALASAQVRNHCLLLGCARGDARGGAGVCSRHLHPMAPALVSAVRGMLHGLSPPPHHTLSTIDHCGVSHRRRRVWPVRCLLWHGWG